jgi:hypothetical protein
MSTTTRNASKRDCTKVLNVIRRQFCVTADDVANGYGPTLVMDWDWTGEPTPAVIWEGGPYDWAIYVGYGGRMETGYHAPDLSDEIPDTVFVEPYSGWAVSIYRN